MLSLEIKKKRKRLIFRDSIILGLLHRPNVLTGLEPFLSRPALSFSGRGSSWEGTAGRATVFFLPVTVDMSGLMPGTAVVV